jgi:hypothetical protein
MASLVSQDEAAGQLRLNVAALTAGQLADLNSKAEMASAIVVDYLKRPFIEGPLEVQPIRRAPPAPVERIWTDQPGMNPWPGIGLGPPPAPSVPPVPPPPWTPNNVPTLVKAAILIVLTALYDGRSPEDALLSPAVCDILTRLRDPALA